MSTLQTNRDKLSQMEIYDLLCRIQSNIDGTLKEECICMIEAITGKSEQCYGTDCKLCIAAWLNEEVK